MTLCCFELAVVNATALGQKIFTAHASHHFLFSMSQIQFGSKLLFFAVSLAAIALSLSQFPLSIISLAGTYLVIKVSPLRGESLLTTCIHNAIVGVGVGLLVATLVMLLGSGLGFGKFDWLLQGLISMPTISCMAGVLYGYWQQPEK